MNDHETDVLDTLRDSMDGVAMRTPVEGIVRAGRTRRRRRRVAGAATGIAVVAVAAAGVPLLTHTPAAPQDALSTGAGSVHIRTAGFALDTHADGTVHVTWDKQRYFEDHEGLQQALRKAGFPVLVKEGVFCKGPDDDGYLSPSGGGHGVDRVRGAVREADGDVTFIFKPAAMPAGRQLFIGYLSPAQLAVTHGRPGSVERLVPTTGPLKCDTQAPPPK